jgi:hypothetical protein
MNAVHSTLTQESTGDIDPDGQIIKDRFQITGWRTRNEDEEGYRVEASMGDVVRHVALLLKDGYVQLIVEAPRLLVASVLLALFCASGSTIIAQAPH